MAGLPDDPSDRPTQMAHYGASPPLVLDRSPDVLDTDATPEPWYRSRVLLGLWCAAVALLLSLIGYGIVELWRGGGETTGPSRVSSSTSTSPPATTPAQSSSTTPATPSATPESPERQPEDAPPPANNPAPAEPPQHHHHVPHVPPTITLPHTVITLPHGF